MNKDPLEDWRSKASEWNEEALEKLKSQGERIEKSSQKYSKLSPLVLRGILFGFIGILLGALLGIAIGFAIQYNPYGLAGFLSPIVASITLSYGVYTGRGGMKAVKIANLIQNIDEELNRILNDIKRLEKENAPKELIEECWEDYKDLRKKRSKIARADSLIGLKGVDDQLAKEVSEAPLLPSSDPNLELPPLQEKVNELEKETFELKDKIEELRKELE